MAPFHSIQGPRGSRHCFNIGQERQITKGTPNKMKVFTHQWKMATEGDRNSPWGDSLLSLPQCPSPALLLNISDDRET